MPINNDSSNRITQAFTNIKEAGKSAIETLKGLVKPKESGRADKKDSNVQNEGGKTSSLLTKSGGSSESISSTARLAKSLSGGTGSIAEKITAEMDDPRILKGTKDGYGDDSKGIRNEKDILGMVARDSKFMENIGTELQQDEKFMAKLYDQNPDKFEDTFSPDVLNAAYKHTDAWKNSPEFKKRMDDPRFDKEGELIQKNL